MSKYGLKITKQYGSNLNEFNNISEAEAFFFSYRDDLLDKFSIICNKSRFKSYDYSIESLKELEKWYFELFEEDKFSNIGLSREEFEQCMAMYFGEVVIRNNEDAKYVVKEFPFVTGKYEFYINKGLLSIAFVLMCNEWYTRSGNKRRNLLFREYNRYFKR